MGGIEDDGVLEKLRGNWEPIGRKRTNNKKGRKKLTKFGGCPLSKAFGPPMVC
jgi:hypothetical protein